MDNELKSAYLLHGRPYRETSLLGDFFSLEVGRISAIVRGVRRMRSPWRGLLQPFTPLWINWSGRHELVTLKTAEMRGAPAILQGSHLWSGLYLNELLVRLLSRCDPHPVLYQSYRETLDALALKNSPEPSLRRFELVLLRELGFGLSFSRDSHGNSIEEKQLYQFRPEAGFFAIDGNVSGRYPKETLFTGTVLSALHSDLLLEEEVLRSAKRLSRLALNHLLDHRPLMSRRLLQEVMLYK